MKRKSTKETILYILKKYGELSMKDLMEQFTISEAAVRKQLNELLRLGFVRERTIKKAIGRPYHLYKLTTEGHQTFPNRYEMLPVELLQDLESSQGKAIVHQLLATRKDREELEISDQINVETFKERVQEVMAHQEQKGYMVDIQEKENGDFKIMNYNCPIYNLASQYKIVCKYEKDMYSNLFSGSKVQAHECMTQGENYCCWTITKPENAQ